MVQNRRVKCPTNQLNCNVCTKANNLSESDNVAGGGDTILAAEGVGEERGVCVRACVCMQRASFY